MDSVLVSISNVDTSLAVLDPPFVCATGGTVRLRAGVASSYQWLLNGNPIAGQTARDFTATSSGVYRVALVNSLGCRDTSRAVTITIYPTPTAAATPAAQSICSGSAISAIALSGAVNGTTYTWTRDNTGTVTGMAGSGNGNTISGSLTNTTNAPVTVTFTITPSANGCTGTPTTATVIVNPIPNAVASPVNQVICSGASINTIAFSGNVSGTTYTWTRDNTGTVTGIAGSGTGNISGSLTNNSNAPVTVTFTITPSANGCNGSPITVTVIVNPIPNAVATPSAQTICSGTAINTIAFSGNVSGNTYTWTRDNTGTVTGIAGSGTGNISGSLTNTTNAPVLVTFTITPNANSCAGTSITAIVLVNPTPAAVAAPASQIICSGSSINTIVLSGNVSGTTYTWTRDNTTTVTGIGASGSGNITGTLTSSLTVPVTVTFTITPTANTCPGTAITATVLVNPLPTGTATPANQTICSGNSITPVLINGPVAGTVFNWTRDNLTNVSGIASTGSGTISGSLINNTALPQLVTFTYQPQANGCTGPNAVATVLVNPRPVGTISSASPFVCQGGSTLLTATGANTYQWYLDGQAIAGATGATLNATQQGVYTVQLISTAGCTNMASNSVTLILITKPTADFSFDKYCAGVSTQFTDLSTIAGSGIVTYNWNFGGGNTSILQNPVYTFTSSGIYPVGLTVTPVVCPSLSSFVTKTIQVQSPPANQRYPSVNAVENRDLALAARTITGASYLWSPAAGLSNVGIRTPVFNYNQEKQYLITIQTVEGCVARDTLLVRIFKQADILVPEGFSPNGDGHNDLLMPRLVGIQRLKYFRIYDRWGQLVFQTDVEGKGWDGQFKGVKQPMETYGWIAEGISVDGSTIKRSGSFLLMR